MPKINALGLSRPYLHEISAEILVYLYRGVQTRRKKSSMTLLARRSQPHRRKASDSKKSHRRECKSILQTIHLLFGMSSPSYLHIAALPFSGFGRNAQGTENLSKGQNSCEVSFASFIDALFSSSILPCMLNSKTNIIPMDDYDSNTTGYIVSSSPQISCSRAICRALQLTSGFWRKVSTRLKS